MLTGGRNSAVTFTCHVQPYILDACSWH